MLCCNRSHYFRHFRFVVLCRFQSKLLSPVAGHGFYHLTVKPSEQRSPADDLLCQNTHGRSGDNMGTGRGFHRILHESGNVKLILGQAGVLDFVR